MWAYRMTAPRQMERFTVPDIDPENLAEGHLLLRTIHGGLCGSDYPGYKGLPSQLLRENGTLAAELDGFPLHEVVGEVIVDPTGAHQPGTVVVGWATGFDALAELVSTRAASVVAVPEDIAIADAITLQPLACILYTLDRLADCLPGARVAIIGLGPIGLLFAHAAKARGAGHVTGVDPIDRTEDAVGFGVDELITTNSERWAAGLRGEADKFDVIIEAVGHQVATLSHCVSAVRLGGSIFYFGIPDDLVYPFPMAAFLRRHARLISGGVMDHSGSLHDAVAYAREHPELLARNISHRFASEQANEAFEVATSAQPGRRKVVLDY